MNPAQIRPGPATCRGAILLFLMFAVALMGIVLAVGAGLWHTAAVRDKEAQLLFVGGEYQRALARYKAATPAGMPSAPERLEQLLLDQRHQVPARHLRRLYRDPMTDSSEWGLIKEGGRIAGVYSLGAGKPLKQANFPEWLRSFSGAKSYATWQFLDKPGTLAAAGGVAAVVDNSAAPLAAAVTPAQSNNDTGSGDSRTPVKPRPQDFCDELQSILAQCDPTTPDPDGKCRGALRAARACQSPR
jgi:type II secretory pathway pseudopilin PulG